MKKTFAVIMALAMMLSSALAHATDLSVQLIGSADPVTTAVSLDDIQIGTSYTLDGYAIVEPRDFQIVDCFAQFGETGDYGVGTVGSQYDSESSRKIVYSYIECGFTEADWRYNDASWVDSGRTAEFVWLVMDITNLQKKDVDYAEEAIIKAVYQDDYELDGWIRQINYDNLEDIYTDGGISRYIQEVGTYPMIVATNPAMNEAVGMMYSGTYAIGCTLSNYVIDDEESPLRIEIQLGDNTLTYNIRK